MSDPTSPFGSGTGRSRVMSPLKARISSAVERIGNRNIARLLSQRERVVQEVRSIPDRMQEVTNQARLVLELVDDFKAGVYRDIPWHSIAVAAGALLYSVNPADVVPDAIPGLGALDDVVVITLAMRLIRRDLKAYCRFKGYDPAAYFGSS